MDNYFAYQVKTLMQQENSTMNRGDSKDQFQSQPTCNDYIFHFNFHFNFHERSELTFPF